MAARAPLTEAGAALYRRLLRAHRRWPAEPDRPGRNVRDALLTTVRARFREVRPGRVRLKVV
jgi:hypothetical protein